MQHLYFSVGEESDSVSEARRSPALLLSADRTQRLTAQLSGGKQP
jgi:hypothetical protein